MDSALDYPQIFKSLSSGARKKLSDKHHAKDPAADFGRFHSYSVIFGLKACMAKSLALQESPELAAVFFLGKAKCEFAAKNFISEASSLFTAAKYFIQSDDKQDCTNTINYEDNLNCATICLLRSSKIYELNALFTLATNVYIYLIDTLMRRHHYGKAMPYLKRTLEIVSRDLLFSLELYKRLSHCQLRIHDWSGALNTFIHIQQLVNEELNVNVIKSNPISNDIYYQYWINAEIFRVLLILICSPSYRLGEFDSSGYSIKIYQDILKNIEKPYYLDEDLFILLQSLILAFQTKDIVELESLSSSLQFYLDLPQRELVLLLIQQLIQQPCQFSAINR